MIIISDTADNYEKEVEEGLKREIKEELKKGKFGSRRKIGLILSGIGGILYLFLSIVAFLMKSWLGDSFILPLIAGAISLIGTIIAIKKAKIGGMVILLSIPISIVISASILHTYFIINLLIPFPFPHSVFVIIGGFLCFSLEIKQVPMKTA